MLQYRHCYSYMEVHSSQIHTHAYTKGKTFTFIYFHFLKTDCETLICSLDLPMLKPIKSTDSFLNCVSPELCNLYDKYLSNSLFT